MKIVILIAAVTASEFSDIIKARVEQNDYGWVSVVLETIIRIWF